MNREFDNCRRRTKRSRRGPTQQQRPSLQNANAASRSYACHAPARSARQFEDGTRTLAAASLRHAVEITGAIAQQCTHGQSSIVVSAEGMHDAFVAAMAADLEHNAAIAETICRAAPRRRAVKRALGIHQKFSAGEGPV